MLYERNYFELTDKELADIKKATKSSTKDGGLTTIDYRIYPKAGFFNKCLFPNNRLDIDDLKNNAKSIKSISEFGVLINQNTTTERDILNFIRDNRAYFIVASVLTEFHFGHHSAYAFPEFELPPNYKVDYLIIGKSSYGYEFVFVELENPYKSITTNDGSLGTTFRKGLKQVSDWNSWLESNFSHLKLMFEKHQDVQRELPKEFHKLDTSRIHYVVVAGRRSDFKEETYKQARKMKSDRVHIFHYDNLIDKAQRVLENNNYV